MFHRSARGFLILLGVAVCACVSLAPGARTAPLAAGGDPGQLPYRTDRVLVAFHPGAARTAVRAAAQLGLAPDPDVRSPHFAALRLGPGPRAAGDPIPAVLAALRRNPAVRVAEPDYRRRVSGIPSDPRFRELFGLHNTGQSGGRVDADIDAPEAWEVTQGSPEVVVAVLDTGVDYTHPDLRENILRREDGSIAGYDFSAGDADPMDESTKGHGTHCAGIIAARAGNGTGVVGVAPNVRLMPVRWMDRRGDGWVAEAILAVDFARENGAHIMSNSYGTGSRVSQLELEAIRRARDAGILFVAAVDNESRNNDRRPSYPCGYNALLENVLAVAASTHADKLAYYSGYGPRSVELAAPGDRIVSTLPRGRYGRMSGTSMATPHVAGAAALLLSRFPDLTLPELRARLLAGADRPAAIRGRVAAGRLNAYQALTGARR